MSMTGGDRGHQPGMPNPRGGTRTETTNDPVVRDPAEHSDGRHVEADRRPNVPRPDRDAGEIPTHDVIVEPMGARNDRIRWGSIWAGLAVALATFIMLQLLYIAVEAIDLTQTGQSDAWWTAAAAVLAFVLGGATAGASAKWTDMVDGVLHGTVMWAAAVAAVLLLSLLGGSAFFGALDATGAFDQVVIDLEQGTIDGLDTDGVSELGADTAREAASWALLGLGVAWAAAAIGALLGAALWPKTREVPGLDPRTTAR